MTALILVLDDDPPLRALLTRLLRGEGYEAIQADSAREARRLMASHRVDLVISDVSMPGESGIAFRRALAHEHPDLPVILMSGFSSEDPVEFAARTPRTVFVPKPFPAVGMSTLVADTLARWPRAPHPAADA
mgnify:CR=1 FL=1